MDQIVRAPDNPFSSSQFKMIKLVERLLITLPDGRRTLFPFELQIMNKTTYLQTEARASNHNAYESRQLKQVRRRVFGHHGSFGYSHEALIGNITDAPHAYK